MQIKKHLAGYLFGIETPDYLERKLEDARSFSVAMFFVASFLGPMLWVWDYVTDPVGARETIWFRLMYVSLVVFAFLFRYVRNRRVLALASMSAMLLGEVIFVEILNHLAEGMTYGIGGFVIFLYAPVLLFSGLSLRENLVYLIIAPALPQLLAVLGMADGFQHDHYAVLIWPTALTMAVVQFLHTHNYWRRYRSELALKIASNTDPMTGLSNRRHFIPQLQLELARAKRFARPVSLLMLDIDNFKQVNDTYGHPTGDVVICVLADICRKVSRGIDIICRWGGEEFAIMLPETSANEAQALAERIRATVEKTVVTSLGNISFRFTVSVGAAEQVLGDVSDERLIGRADAALYQAKDGGRNRVAALWPNMAALV